MPRSNLCKQQMRLSDFIRGRFCGRSQRDVAEGMGISQQVLSRKLKYNRFTNTELQKLIKILGFTDSEIIFAMRECR